jgi:hypothetical protein
MRSRIWRGLVAGLFVAAVAPLTTAAYAEETKPVIAVKSKVLEIEVTIDPAFKAHPGLYENLLAEAKRDAAKWKAEAPSKRDPASGHGAEYARAYTLRSVIQKYVSVLRSDGSFTGGAHPNSYTDTILWDRDAKKRISIRPFFKEMTTNGPTMTALAKLVRAAVYAEKKTRDRPVEDSADTDTWLKEITPDLLKIGPVTLAPSSEANKSSGLTLHYSPYMVGPYAEGSLTAFVPWTSFKDFLSPEGAALFAGERPDGDDANLD